ncbi:long-chain-fatty-acid-CoA ligase [Methylocaldum marinum]|uniref:Long-chain-fatty-acid-CoA ligase n=1 Tax=Methylocaldum marinum TaxID=1432792 RepID=A0A250KV46_9GAMM|nr:long-chain-fatty-acid-CoA ligase [Methylocaldum marinum]
MADFSVGFGRQSRKPGRVTSGRAASVPPEDAVCDWKGGSGAPGDTVCDWKGFPTYKGARS